MKGLYLIRDCPLEICLYTIFLWVSVCIFPPDKTHHIYKGAITLQRLCGSECSLTLYEIEEEAKAWRSCFIN